MKTVVIMHGTELNYYLFPGDLSHLNGVYINQDGVDEEKEAELVDVMYDNPRVEASLTLDEFAEEVRNGAKIIQVGFLY